jgi:soluble lytic murein transglycosylase-like protein
VKAALVFPLLCCAAGAVQPGCEATPPATMLDLEMCWTDYYARAYDVPLEFVQAVIDVESGWHPYLISTKGAAGLMQSRHRLHVRRDQPFSDRGKHSGRSRIPGAFDSAV